MKRFFYFFIVLFLLLTSFSESQAQVVFEEIKENIQTGLDKANGGISPDAEMPFGRVRLASCRTGFKNVKGMATAVEVSLKNGWILKEVHIFPVKSKDYQATVLPVFNTKKKTSENWETDYINNPIFPIWLEPLSQQEITLSAMVNFRACHSMSGICDHYTNILSLNLPADESYVTHACGAINHSLIAAAVDIDKTPVQTEHQLLDNGDIKIRLTFPKKIQHLDIKSVKGNLLTPLFSNIGDNTFTTILHRDTPIQIGETLSFQIRSSGGCYLMKTEVKSKEPLVQHPQKISWWIIFWTGLIFFALSPVWSYWLMPQSMGKNQKELKKRIRQLQLSAGIGIFVLLLLWIFNFSFVDLLNYPFVGFIFVCLIIYLLIKPIQPIWAVGTLIVILPKPFWDWVTLVPNGTKIGLACWWFLCLYMPLNIWLIYPQGILNFFKQVQKENISAYPHVVRLSYWLLLAWMVLIGIGQFYFRSDKIFDPQNIKKPAIVRVTAPTCLSCIRERAFIFSSLDKEVIPLYRLDFKNKWAKEKKNDYQIRKNTFNLLLTPDGREIVLPEKLSRYKLKKILETNFNP